MAKARRKKEVFKVSVQDAMFISDLARHLPGKPHCATVRRYCLRGIISPVSGRRVKMQYIHRPKGIASTVDAYFHFLEELNERVSCSATLSRAKITVRRLAIHGGT